MVTNYPFLLFPWGYKYVWVKFETLKGRRIDWAKEGGVLKEEDFQGKPDPFIVHITLQLVRSRSCPLAFPFPTLADWGLLAKNHGSNPLFSCEVHWG